MQQPFCVCMAEGVDIFRAAWYNEFINTKED